jgi:hypothetical protein
VLGLPPGYLPVNGGRYQVGSRAEYTSFIEGPRNDAGIPVAVRWPGVQVAAVVAGDRRLALTRGGTADPYLVRFTLPVFRASPTADSSTLQVWSYLSGPETGLTWLVPHNDPDRAAGYWATARWPAGESRAVLTYMVACEAILRGTGLLAEARRRGHFFVLEGFETNNLLHQDNPPHWHLSYYPGPTMAAAGATVPHFWVDPRGRTFFNGQDVQGRRRIGYRVNQPAPILDGQGRVVLTTIIRADGGLDLQPPIGPRFAIVSDTGDYTAAVKIYVQGLLWRTVTTSDDVRGGVMRTDVRGGAVHERVEYRYDPLTGPVTNTYRR